MELQIVAKTKGHCTKMKFSIMDFVSKCVQIRRKLQIWSHLLKKSLMENLIFCAVGVFIALSNIQKEPPELFCKRRALKISRYLQKNTVFESILIKQLIFKIATLLKRDLTQAFSCEYSEIFKNINLD